MKNAGTLSEIMAGFLISSWTFVMLAELSTLLDTSLSRFPIYPDPIVNKLAVSVYEHGGQHVEIGIVFLVLVLIASPSSQKFWMPNKLSSSVSYQSRTLIYT
ncbi:hypothetical protein GYMLUDRAFT_43992 [Collybiopsis luxurians FD-317 M1]|uniref:Uncharacterized protein n=1 Tax=Collybiopsis luxurians FD-317 M1 TaxID=944289 RepID=A0A0D0B8T2_9AGAR|nr:hypothetical protein GYMLUDRAFT_43992 [Collybiopsis luxurians FD-317 M1]